MKKILMLGLALILSLTVFAEWNFRGTPNSWASEAMTYNSSTGLYETTQTFGTDSPRFKIDRYGNWAESYPTADYTVTGGKTYKITFNASSKAITAVEDGFVDTWYFRGTANSWGTTLMTYNSSTGLYETSQTFGTDSPRFKICHDTTWTESYPTADYTVTGSATYAITFNASTKAITAVVGGQAPVVGASPAGQNFSTETLTITLTVTGNSLTAIKYTVDGTDPSTSTTATTYSNNQAIVIGSDMAVNDQKTVRLYAENADGIDTESYTYTKTAAAETVKIYYKSASGAPTVWAWEGSGAGGTGNQPISELMGDSYPGRTMTLFQGEWYVFEITADYLPLTGNLSMIFNSGSTVVIDITKPWYDGTTWYAENPDVPQAPTISLNVSTTEALVGTKAIVVTVTAQNATVDTKSASFNGQALTFSGDEASFVLGDYIANTQTGTLVVNASNSLGVAELIVDISRDDSNVKDFTWDNALVYFVMTDRFSNGDSSNDSSYGRTNNYGGSLTDTINTATYHGGDIKGMTNKLEEGYFEDLGVNAIWITAPYEQAHGFVGGGYSNGTATYPHYAYHGYYTLDWTEMDKNVGTVEEFRTFVKTAHSQGIRVVLDIVMNHTGYETITDAVEYGFGGVNLSLDAARAWTPSNGNWGSFSSYYAAAYDSSWNNWWGSAWIRSQYYGTGGSDDLTKCLDYLPDFKTEEGNNVGLAPLLQTKWARETSGFENWIIPAASGLRQNLGIAPSDYQKKWLAAWVEEFGIDGFRVDTAKHVNIYRWQELKNECATALNNWRNSSNSNGDDAKSWTDNFWMTGEVWGHGVGRSEYFDNGFDSIINFDFPKGTDTSSIGSTWASYAAAINTDSTFNVLSYLNSHDARQNYGWVTTSINAGTCLVLSPGGVQIYYGDEVVRPLAGDMTNDLNQCTRSDYKWSSQNTTVLAHWQKLGQFRKNNSAVGAGTQTDLGNNTYGRSWQGNDVVIKINGSGTTSVNVSGFFANGEVVTNAYNGQTATVSNGAVTFTAENGVILIER